MKKQKRTTEEESRSTMMVDMYNFFMDKGGWPRPKSDGKQDRTENFLSFLKEIVSPIMENGEFEKIYQKWYGPNRIVKASKAIKK